MLLARICSILSCLDLSHVSLQLLATISQLRPVSKWSLPVATWSLRFCLMPCLPPWRARDLSLSRWEVLLLGWQAIVRNSNEFLLSGRSAQRPLKKCHNSVPQLRSSSSSSATPVQRASSCSIWRTAAVQLKQVRKAALSAPEFDKITVEHWECKG